MKKRYLGIQCVLLTCVAACGMDSPDGNQELTSVFRKELDTQTLVLSPSEDQGSFSQINVADESAQIIYANFTFEAPPSAKSMKLSVLESNFSCPSSEAPEAVDFSVFPQGRSENKADLEPGKLTDLPNGQSMVLQVRISNARQCDKMEIKFVGHLEE